MTVRQVSEKSFVTVTEMAEFCQLSRSRFYDLVEAGVFPRPALHPSSKRPMYDRTLQDACLEIRQTGIGANGLPVLFNRRPMKRAQPKPLRKPAEEAQPDHADLLDALKGLGLTTTPQAVKEALAALYPYGACAGIDQGEVVRKVFLYFQGRKK
jgi:hypothetical protein